jgi:hypothetical protein
MNIAWFRPTTPDASDPLDDTAALIDELRSTHAIDVIVEAGAHDFVWRHFQRPWDLCVYELDNTSAHQFEWAYLLNYAGVVMLKSPVAHNSWGATLSREGRLDEYMAGFRFEETNAPPEVRVPLLASRCVVVPHRSLAESLQEEYPEARVRYAPMGVQRVQGVQGVQRVQGVREQVKFGLLDRSRRDIVERAFQRARDAGANIDLLTNDSAARILAECDAVVALTWPPFETPLTPALAGMAAGKAVVAMEIEATAHWPALDPQTWRPRGLGATAAPIAVTIEPRDEEHSLMLAMRRLTTDLPLREQLGHSAHAWWQAHATPAHAAAAWNPILQEAGSLTPPLRPPDWPKHLGADGTELARAILNEFGLTSDI